MKKAFDQTVRDLKRGVNKKVLKVPSVEQKVLDATSNESWGPHGSLLADIAMASRNHHEYQMIMTVIWKRINDTGKNWRHVYKGLTVLEYLVANGSERVINEIREHAYQITSLSDFQYLDHTGRDQGSNVRKKSQSLVALVNDKEKIQEVRQKAAANWDKFHNTSGGMRNRPGAGGGFDDNNGYGYGRERDYSYGGEEYNSSSRGRTSYDGGDTYDRDRERERAYEDDGPYSSRESNEKADSQSHDGRNFERKSSEQDLGVPPSYEDAVAAGRSPIYSERDGEIKSVSPPVTTSHETTVSTSPAVIPLPVTAATPPPPPVTATSPPPATTVNNNTNGFDEFDPRASFPMAPPTSTEMDLFGSSSDPFSLNELALVPVTVATSEPDVFTNSNPPGQSQSQSQTFVAASSAPNSSAQSFDDPFGDGPFRAVPSTNGFSAPPRSTPSGFGQSAEPPQSATPTPDPTNSFGFVGSFDQTTDILADLLPPPGPSQTGFQAPPELPPQTNFQSNFPGQPSFQGGQPGQPSFQSGQLGQPSFQSGQPSFQGGQPSFQGGQPSFQSGQPGQPSFQGGQPNQPSFQSGQPSFQGGQPSFQSGQPSFQSGQPSFQSGQPGQPSFQSGQPSFQGGQPSFQGGQFMSHGGQTGGFPSQMGSGFHGSNGEPTQQSNSYVGFEPQGSSGQPVPASQSNTSSFYQQPQAQSQSGSSLNASTGALVIVPQEPPKFETKSTVWADTLTRGLVNLNIAGSKTNPMSNIGVDFEALNRKEKRMEKPSATPVTSNITMGKAMGSGSGIGRAGVGALRPQPNPMMGPTMAGPAPGYGPGYGGMNQPMGQFQMQPPAGGYPPPGSYNPMMGRGRGGYGQQPYGGYR